MDERDFFNETTESRSHTLTCPKCGQAAEYKVSWVVRRKKPQLPRNADERDRAKFASRQTPIQRHDAYAEFERAEEHEKELESVLSQKADPVLLWGDARLGNLIFDDDAEVRAVLDWDLAAIGPPEMDLGWYFGLEFMMQQLFGQRVPGFPDRAAAVERYQASSGRAVANLDWHEVFALLRALAINDRHQRIADEERQQATWRPPSPRRVQNPMIDVLAARLATAG